MRETPSCERDFQENGGGRVSSVPDFGGAFRDRVRGTLFGRRDSRPQQRARSAHQTLPVSSTVKEST